MVERFVGFYWTLPVRWAGFNRLPKSPEDAAAKSITIRYQLALSRRHADREHGELVDGVVFLESRPDRGTAKVKDKLDEAIAKCRKHQATLLYVDFAEAFSWRQHPQLLAHLELANVKKFPLLPDKVQLDGRLFDPFAHFAEWKAKNLNATAEINRAVTQEIIDAAADHSAGKTYREITDDFNNRGVPNVRGGAWGSGAIRQRIRRLRNQTE